MISQYSQRIVKPGPHKAFRKDDICAYALRATLTGVCVMVLICSCGKGSVSSTTPAGKITGLEPYVSIGLLNTVDTNRQQNVIRFFSAQGVSCSIEGSVIFDVMVHRRDVEQARSILSTAGMPDPAFYLNVE